MKILYTKLVILVLILIQVQADPQPDDVLNYVYTGQFLKTGGAKLFNYLDVSEGNVYFYFLTDLKTRQQGGGVSEVVVQLLNPKYRDLKVIQVVVNLTDYDSVNHEWIKQDVQIDVYKFYKENFKQNETCKGNFSVKLIYETGNWNARNVVPQVEFKSNGQNMCDFSFTAEGIYVQEKYKVLGYCGFISAIILVQIACAYKLMRQITNNEVNCDKLSLLTISIVTIQDFFLTMMHMYFLMTQKYYQYFILPIFLLVLLSIVFDMRILLIVWRTKYIEDINNGLLRRKITIFYVQFYIGMFGFLIIMYFFTYQIWPLYLQVLVFLPQIVHNVRKGNNPQFYYAYVLGLLGMRIVLPLYYRGCPDNIYLIEPNKAFCVVWGSLFVIQILILFVQKQFGPRFFIPKKFIPGHFEYRYKLQLQPTTEPPECTICIGVIGFDENDLSLNSSSINDNLIKKTVTVMRTPCNHFFHPECLSRWMDVKLQCPSCRLQLPPIM